MKGLKLIRKMNFVRRKLSEYIKIKDEQEILEILLQLEVNIWIQKLEKLDFIN